MNVSGSKHLNLDDRKFIERALFDGLSCGNIANAISKDPRTISREIFKRRNKEKNGKFGILGKVDYSPCPSLTRFPFVCNACSKRFACFRQFKFFYDANLAHDNYLIVLRDSRIGLDVTLEDKQLFDTVLKNGINNGQSIHHIIKSNPDLCYKKSSAYKLVDKCQTVVQSIDLVRKVKLKPRKHYIYKEDNKAIRNGRSYIDLMRFLAINPSIVPTQIDTVEGVKEGFHKCFLTIHFPAIRFMLIFLLDRKTKQNVSNVFIKLQKHLGSEIYKKLFSVILTDRGTEFCDPEKIEIDQQSGEILSHVYFCDAYSSFQKAAIEENHTLLRRIVPKGIIFDDLTQEKVNIIQAHINSFERDIIQTTPYTLAVEYFGKDIVDKLNCDYINPKDVTLSTKHLR